MGAFVLLMPHHVKTLQICKEHCDKLMVLINDDNYIIKKKGCLPLTAFERRNILLELECVDSVSIVPDQDMKRFVDEFYSRFIENSSENTLTIFHSHELRDKKVMHLPGADYANEVIILNDMGGTSVSRVFDIIREAKDE
jgi:glycerol-3-phosphate cytidylyltransferase-like family protein